MLTDAQRKAADWVANNSGLLLATPGTGKTRTMLHALNSTGEQALIIAPANVARRTWHDEAKQFPTSRPIVLWAGSPKKRQLIIQRNPRAHIIVSYELAPKLLKEYGTRSFDIIVFDEVTKLRNPRGKRFQKIRDLSKSIEHRIGLTGTPVPNHYHQLFGQLAITAGMPMLFEEWLCKYFEPTYIHIGWSVIRVFKDGPKSWEKIKPLLTARSHTMPLPSPSTARTIDHWVQIPATLKKNIAKVFEDDAPIVVRHQLAQGRVYNGSDYQHLWATDLYHTAKQDQLQDLFDDLQGQPALVFYQFKHDIDVIKTAVIKLEDFRGDIRIEVPDTPKKLSDLLPDWNAGKINVLVVHPASAGHGLNLQHGGNQIIWYGLPLDAELYEQGNRRLDRQGQKHQVFIHRILTEDSLDAYIAPMLDGKQAKSLKAFDSVTAAIKRQVNVSGVEQRDV